MGEKNRVGGWVGGVDVSGDNVGKKNNKKWVPQFVWWLG
jgi:hypothetical protein